MRSWKIFWLFQVHFLLCRTVNGGINVRIAKKLNVIEYTSRLLCESRLKTVYVYFENYTSMEYPSQILKELNHCGISYISIRNKFKRESLEVIKDDGVLMYLVMMLRDVSQNPQMSIVRKKSAAKHLSHIIMIIQDPKSITERWLKRTFKQFWKIWILNIVIMYNQDSKTHIYRYNPFADEYLIPVEYKNGSEPKLKDLFPKKLANMQGKPLRMCLYHNNIRAILSKSGKTLGSDALMAKYVANSLNATRIIDEARPYGFQNISTDICFREIQTELDDAALNIRFLSLATFKKHVEYTIVHSRDDLCVVVPKAATTSLFWNLFRSFHVEVWISVISSVVLTYIFCLLAFRKMVWKEMISLQLLAGVLTLPLTKKPKRNALKILLFFWLFFGILICTAFRGNLTSNLVFKKYLPDINTIKDLALSPYNIFLRPRHVKHLKIYLNSSDPHEVMLHKKLVIVPDAVLDYNVDNNNLSNAYVQKAHVASFLVNARRHYRYNRPLFHVMESSLVPFHAVFIVPYGSPYLGFINTLIRNSQEYGFTVYWNRLMSAQFIKSGRSVLRNRNNNDDPVVLKLQHFQSAFCLLFIGYFFALIVFIWEVNGGKKGIKESYGKIWAIIVKKIMKTDRDNPTLSKAVVRNKFFSKRP